MNELRSVDVTSTATALVDQDGTLSPGMLARATASYGRKQWTTTPSPPPPGGFYDVGAFLCDSTAKYDEITGVPSLAACQAECVSQTCNWPGQTCASPGGVANCQDSCTHPRVPKFDCDAVRYSDASGSGTAAGTCILYYRCLATMTRADTTSGTGYTLWSRRVYGISNGAATGLVAPAPPCAGTGGVTTFATIEQDRMSTMKSA